MESKSRMRGRKLDDDDDDDDDDDGSSWDEARTSVVAIARGCRGVGRIMSAHVVPTQIPLRQPSQHVEERVHAKRRVPGTRPRVRDARAPDSIS